MKADLSRNSFARSKNFGAVRQQQGRVLIDADWNEQSDIAADRDRRFSVDVLNADGAPVEEGGFAIQVADNAGQDDLQISAGRFYVNGLLAENENQAWYSAQPDLPGAALPTEDGVYLAYLDAWERGVDYFDDGILREEALNGADTADRIQTIAQTKLLKIGESGTVVPPAAPPTVWSDITDRVLPGLTARALAAGAPDTSCDGGGYRGIDNALYRVEIHQGGAPGTATFKWSRSNAGLSQEWESQDGDELTVRAPLLNSILPELKAGDWVELTDAGLELENRRGTLVRLAQVDGRVLTVDPASAIHFDPAVSAIDLADFSRGVRRIRPWDMTGASGEITTPASGWLEIEEGVEVRFDSADYRSGDYWTIAARSATRSLLWPCEDGVGPVTQAAEGVRHNYAQLAFLENQAGSWTLLRDCRRRFASRTNAKLECVSGSGQEALPGQSLAAPLQVRVTRGDQVVPEARVRFEITAGTGVLSDSLATVSGASLDIVADANGLAEILWQLDAATEVQKTRATLLDAISTGLPATIDFVANQSVAARVAYDTVAGGDSVEDVLDRLGSDKINRAGDTVTGSITVQENLEVRGTLNAQGDVLANAQNVAGDIQLGNQDDDQVRVYGEVDSAHSSGMLEVADDLRVREDLIVDGRIGVNAPVNDAALTVGGAIESKSAGYQFPDGTIQTTAGGGSDSIPAGMSILGESALPPAGFVYTGKRIETEDPEGFRLWTQRANLPQTRADQVVEVVGDQIYMIGGSDVGVGSYTTTTFRYAPETNSWSPLLASMNTARGGAASAVLDGYIHVVCGQVNPTDITNTHERYDLATDTWSPRNGPAIPLSFSRAVAVAGQMYMMGGWNSGGVPQTTLQVYDPQADSWVNTLAPMNDGRSVFGIGVYKNRIYVFGGQGSSVLSAVEYYDISADAWTSVTPMLTAKYGFGVSVIDGKFVIYGGQDSGGVDLRNVDIYDPETDHWETSEDLPAQSRSPGWATIDNTAYIFGGAIGFSWQNALYARSFPVRYYLHAKSPAPGDGGKLRVLGTDWSHAKLAFTKAENAAGLASELSYRAYFSNEDNIGSIADIDANGTAAGDAQNDVDALTISGLRNGREQFVNVVVEDAAGNRAAYAPAKVEIPYEWKFLDGENTNGVHVNPAADAVRPNVSAYFSQIAGTWEESDSQLTRVLSFDGVGWIVLESGGINSAASSQQPVAIHYRGRLFVARIEFLPPWRIRVSAYDGDRWSSVDNGALNLTGNNAFSPTFAVYEDRLYLGWHEDNPNANRFQIRLMRYEGGDTWLQMDGEGTFASLNYSPSNGASIGGIAGYRDRIFVAWHESQGPEQIRIRALDAGGGWSFVDGGGPTGLNFDTSSAAFGGRLVVYRDELYCSFYEDRAGVTQIRVKKYDGDRWTFVDGGLSTGLNFDVTRAAILEGFTAADGLLFVSWFEANAGGVNQARVAAYDGANWRFVDGKDANGLNADVARNISYPRVSAINDRAVMPFVENVSGFRKIRMREATHDEAPMPAPLNSNRALVYNDRIYVVGLRDTVSVLYEYEPLARAWKSLTPAPTGRANAIVGARNGRIHVLGGGTSGGTDSEAHEIYDIATDTWTSSDPIPGSAGQWTGGLIGDKIYVFGFFNGTLHIYDIPGETWSTGATFTAATSEMSAVVFNERLYVVGGWNGSTTVGTVHEYDPVADAWTPKTSMATARSRVGLATANGRIYAIGGQSGPTNTPQASFEEYDPLANTWRSVNPLGVGLTAMGAAGFGDRIYWFGGTNAAVNTQVLRDVHSRELLLDWRNAAPLPEAHAACPAVLLDGKIHLIGSYRESGPFATTHTVYDPLTETTTTAAPLPEALAYGFGCVIDGKIYYFGGSDSAVALNTDTYVYDPGTDAWTTAAPMLGGYEITFGGLINGKVYIAGSPSTVLRVYDPVLDSWADLAPMPRVHVAGMSAVLNNQLYIMGGTNAAVDTHELVVDVYDPDTDDWTMAAPLPDGRYGAGSLEHNGEIYLLGGYDGVSGFPVRRNSCLKLDATRGAWINLPPLTDEHSHYKPVVFNDTIYVAGGRVATQNDVSRRVEKLPLGDLPPYSPVPTTLPFLEDWTLRNDMPITLAEQAVAEVNGKIYSFGGQAGVSNFVDDSFVYDPVTDAWNTISPLPSERGNGMAAAVGGKVYVIGGIPQGGVGTLATNEEYDPATDSWTPKTPLPIARHNSGVAVLDGLIYILGAQNATEAAKNSVYDPVNDNWTDLADIPQPITLPMCAAVDGKIYVIGGQLGGTPTRTGLVQVYNPATPGWESGFASMPTPRSDAAVAVVGGLIVVAGGYDEVNDRAEVEAYDPATDTWITLAPLSGPRNALEAAVFGRTMFVFGGVNTNALQYFATVEAMSIPEAQTAAPLPSPVASAITETIDGKIYTGFGLTSTPNNHTGDLYEYEPATDSWHAKASGTSRFGANSAVTGGKLHVFGGATDGSTHLDVHEVYDPVDDSWSTVATLNTALREGAACAGPDGKLYHFGGYNGSDLASVEMYDPLLDTWTGVSTLSPARRQSRAVLLEGGIHVIGGFSGSTALATHEVYDPVANSWSPRTALPIALTNGACAVRGGRIYYMGGWDGLGNLNRTVFEFDPNTNTWRNVASLSQEVYSTAATAIASRIYLQGGFDATDTTRAENQVLIFEN